MSNSINEILIETTVKQAIKRIQDDPERSTRNLVDIALSFSNGRFQRRFLEIAQEMLQNEQSSYYHIISDVIANIDSERILTMGMNIGYHSCTCGARKIRKLESEESFNIPWCVSLEIEGAKYQEQCTAYHSLIEQGQELGIYTWLIFCKEKTPQIFELTESFPDCAFIFICPPEEITNTLLDEASSVYNVLFVVTYDEDVEQACQLLRKRRFPYAVMYCYTEDDLEKIINGNLLTDCEILHPVFTILCPTKPYGAIVQENIRYYVQTTRQQQIYKTIPFDFVNDILAIDSIISDEALWLHFDSAGQYQKELNHFQQPLRDILQQISLKSIC